MAWLEGLAILVKVCGRGSFDWLLSLLVLDGMHTFHLSSAAFGGEDDKEEAEDEEGGSKRPPKPSEVNEFVAPLIELAVASVA